MATKVKCPRCNGTGKCDECKGKGKKYLGFFHGEATYSHCNGTGKCKNCKGTGYMWV